MNLKPHVTIWVVSHTRLLMIKDETKKPPLNLKTIYIEYTFNGVLIPFNFIYPLRDALSYKSFFRLIYIS